MLRNELRDEFAKAALQGLLASQAANRDSLVQDVAKGAYEIANAMLIERELHLEKKQIPTPDFG